MSEEFYRIRRLPPYVFAEVNAMKAAARAAGEDIIDLGMGNPDGAPAPHVIEKLVEVARDPNAHGYSASKGIPGLRKAQAGYYARRFGVDLDPDTEVVVTLGSKEGLANLAQAITAPGDVVLAPNPSYPIHTFGFIIAGAAIRSIPAAPGPDFFTRLEHAIAYTVPKPSVLVMGYPSNPTAYVADLDFYTKVVAFAKEHKLWVLSDLAYSEIYFGDVPTPSILQVPGAKDVAIEFTSGVEDLFDGGLADRFRGRQQDADRRADPGEVLSGLRRVHADPGGGGRCDQRPAGHRRAEPPALQAPPRRDGRELRPRRLGTAGACRRRCSAGRRSRPRSSISARSNSRSSCSPTRRSRSRPASASARRARASSGSLWSRMSTASARRRATSSRYLQSMGVNAAPPTRAAKLKLSDR